MPHQTHFRYFKKYILPVLPVFLTSFKNRNLIKFRMPVSTSITATISFRHKCVSGKEKAWFVETISQRISSQIFVKETIKYLAFWRKLI